MSTRRAAWTRLIPALTAVAIALAAPVAVARAQSPEARALFDERVAAYVATRTTLARLLRLPATPRDMRSAETQRTRLAETMQVLRADVAPGSVFDDAVALYFRRVIGGLPESAGVRTWVDERIAEAPPLARVHVNCPLPAGAQQDVHPVLLRALPALPAGVAYRVVDRDLALWDVQTDLVIDVLRHVFDEITM